MAPALGKRVGLAFAVGGSSGPTYFLLLSSLLLFPPLSVTLKDPLCAPSHFAYLSTPAVNRLRTVANRGSFCFQQRTCVSPRARNDCRQARLQFPLMLKDGNAGAPPFPDSLMNLLVQRAVQNKLHFLVAVQNEPVASWMENFLDHKHLKMIKMTDYHCKACYHGIDGLTCNWREYLQKLEGTSEQTIHVQYTPGVSEVESLR